MTVRIGDTVRLLLDDTGMQWGPVSESQSGALRPVPSPAPPAHGQLVTWTAVRPGTDTVKAVGSPLCAAGTACPMFARLFEVTITVT